jgi:hypothetical protein
MINCKFVCTWIFAPGVPPTIFKVPSGFITVNAFNVCAGRLPGAMMLGEAGSKENPVKRLFRRIPVSGIIQELPKPWNTTNFWLVGPRFDVTFTNKLFFTNFLQFNNQTKNMNLNTRLQWRYSPASDLFLVYTDNYISDTFQVRNRALVLKFTYWWNV